MQFVPVLSPNYEEYEGSKMNFSNYVNLLFTIITIFGFGLTMGRDKITEGDQIFGYIILIILGFCGALIK